MENDSGGFKGSKSPKGNIVRGPDTMITVHVHDAPEETPEQRSQNMQRRYDQGHWRGQQLTDERC